MMNSSFSSYHPGAIHPFLQIILFFKSSNCKLWRGKELNNFFSPISSDDLCLFFCNYPSSLYLQLLESIPLLRPPSPPTQLQYQSSCSAAQPQQLVSCHLGQPAVPAAVLPGRSCCVGSKRSCGSAVQEVSAASEDSEQVTEVHSKADSTGAGQPQNIQ